MLQIIFWLFIHSDLCLLSHIWTVLRFGILQTSLLEFKSRNMFLKVFAICALVVSSEAIKLKVDQYGYVKAEKKEPEQDLSKIPGIPGHDYPLYHEFPHTNFDCNAMPAHPGMYANVETGCQGYHVCNDGREGSQGSKFLCTNGTLFSQKDFTCDYWYNVDCHEAPRFYQLNVDPATNPYTKDEYKKKAELAYY
ncbi:CLUMA_CG001891, isoform A [Clunio marinus]|uniref:CLUMA_CG001891, isoform A n=1 Tax=Clunio marinus TaxID=568069 RepID=A0A1J1HKP9_9DIPT|nr:CLUMA_CG001891, isoform A [Clunio marinus]